MSDVLNPVDAEREIRHTSNEIARSIKVVSEAHNAELEAEREYKTAFYRTYISGDGSVKDREAMAYLGTVNEKAAWDVAAVAHKRAKDHAHALSSKLSALQSVLNSVRAMYGAAGAGER